MDQHQQARVIALREAQIEALTDGGDRSAKAIIERADAYARFILEGTELNV